MNHLELRRCITIHSLFAGGGVFGSLDSQFSESLAASAASFRSLFMRVDTACTVQGISSVDMKAAAPW